MKRDAGMMQGYVNRLRVITKMLKSTGIFNDLGRCRVLVWNRKLRAIIQCRNRRKDGKCCVIHSTALDCGEDLIFTTSGRRQILTWMQRHGKSDSK
jgi:hypothetical protein